MIKRLNIVSIIILTIGLLGCSKDDSAPELVITGNESLNKQIIVTVIDSYNANLGLERPVEEVSVKIYETLEDRRNEVSEVKIGETNSQGRIKFQYLEEGSYYIRIYKANLGEKLAEVNVSNDNVIAYVEVWF